ncbi:MAG: acetate--CoA ligase family protein [Pseudomonadota bacterium]
MRDLSRLFAPRTVAVIGGGAWCEGIVVAAKSLKYGGQIIPVHPSRDEIAGLPAVSSLEEIDAPIDAAFVGVNRHITLNVVAKLRDLSAGGAICFASGFSEAAAEDATGNDLQTKLITAAGDMPILGPNCYGFLNALDQCAIWPDQHGLRPVERGVAILTQSSNIAINLSMQLRGLPVAMVVTCGNQAQTSQAAIAASLLEDTRITALGLHIEGFGDLREWEALAAKARARGVPLVAFKSGRSEQAQAAAVSHTASLAGADAGADAFLRRLGIARLHSLPAFLEALKIGHLFGTLPSGNIASISCSGGEAALAADTAHGRNLEFPALSNNQSVGLRDALGSMVALANPLDYHTYIWRDEAAMTRAWAAMADPKIDLTLIILDYPRADMCDPSDWEIATRAAIAAAQITGARYAVCASLPELLPEATAQRLMEAGVLPLSGLDHAMDAIEAMAGKCEPALMPVAIPGSPKEPRTLTESEAKADLSKYGLSVPKGVQASHDDAAAAALELAAPMAVKVLGLAHKTGAAGLALGVSHSALADAVKTLADGPLWIEEMIGGGIVELLVGVARDPAHGFLLTVAAGGTLTELLDDRASVLVPASRDQIETALMSLRIAPQFRGYRGEQPVDIAAVLDAIEALQTYVLDNRGTLEEVEINPLICTATAAVAVDALIRKAPA